METTYLKYQLQNGYIHHWLVAGPFDSSDSGKEEKQPNPGVDEISKDSAKILYPNFLGKPLELNQTIEGNKNYWKWFECGEDHWIDFTNYFSKVSKVKFWAYTILSSSSKETATLHFASNVSILVWINRKLVYQSEYPPTGQETSGEIDITLKKGHNEILVQAETIPYRNTNIFAAIRISNLHFNDCEILLPNKETEAGVNEIRQKLEMVCQNSFLAKYVYGTYAGDKYEKNESIPVLFSENLKEEGSLNMRLQDLDEAIYQEGEKTVHGGHAIAAATNFPLKEGAFHFTLQPTGNDYYIRKMRFDRKHRFFMVRSPYAFEPYGTYEDRKNELIKRGSDTKSKNIFPEIAKMAVEKWNYIDKKRNQECFNSIDQRSEESILNLVGFLGMLYRYRNNPSFPENLETSIQNAYLNYRYWEDEPGTDVMDFTGEGKSILFHTAEILAGQLEKGTIFPNNNMTGEAHINHGTKLAFEWIEQRGQYGFEEWNTSETIADILTAMAHLVDFCENETLVDLALVMMDKVLFILATNTFQGGLGSPHYKSQLSTVVSTRLEPTSGVCRLLWGMGSFNYELAAPLSIALSNYEIPEIIRDIASDSTASLWIQQSNRSQKSDDNQQNIVNLSSYKTRDYMLSSCQDYTPGEPGKREHIWQATLDPDAVVFVNHPGCTSDLDTHVPNLWCGNKILPRVAQWGDFLIAIHNLPDDDWLGYTHAYFPTAAFDEYQITDNWAFARKNNAYLALYAAQGLEFIREGYTALRELRSYGKQNIWLCQMGHALLDNTFFDFQNKVNGLNIDIQGLNYTGSNLRGDQVSFGWDSTLKVNDAEQPISNYPHHQSIYSQTGYPAGKMIVMFGDEGMQLDFTTRL